MGRDSSVGIATRYGLDVPRIESRCWRDFAHPSRPALGPTQPPMQWIPVVKRPGRGVDHPSPPRVEVKEIIQLYLYSPSVPSWPVLEWTLLTGYRVVRLLWNVLCRCLAEVLYTHVVGCLHFWNKLSCKYGPYCSTVASLLFISGMTGCYEVAVGKPVKGRSRRHWGPCMLWVAKQ
jgi:hypothetical protein